MLSFWASSQNCEKRMFALSCLSYRSVRPSVRMELLGSQWSDICTIFENLFRKLRSQLLCDRSNGYFKRGSSG
jgi:hypothetical protein